MISRIFYLLQLLILARAILSWIPHNRYHPLARLLHNITEPILAPFRKLVPPYRMGIDISPILAIIALVIVQRILVAILYGLI